MTLWDESKKITTAILLVSAIFCACATESIIGTALSFGKLDMLGDLYTTIDEFTQLDVSYTTAKLCGFMLVPALFARFRPLAVALTACTVMTLFSLLMICTHELFLLVVIRVIQGLFGGIFLVSGQSILFLLFCGKSKPLIQLIFTCGTVVISTTFASGLQGWAVDTLTWQAIFLISFGFGVAAILLLCQVSLNLIPIMGTKRSDSLGLVFFAIAAFCITYVAQEASRWNWFESTHIIILTSLGGVALLICLCRWIAFPNATHLVDIAVFKNRDFSFGFMVSFVAGIALLGSTFLISGFMLNVLGMTATHTGWLIFLSGIMFLLTLSLVMLLITFTKVTPLATVPFGIFFIILALWLFSNSTSESGALDLFLPLMIRGAGFGFLILSLTIYALGCLKGRYIVQGVALFTTFRQLGGLFGVALLQRYLDHQNALNKTVLSSYLKTGEVAPIERLSSIKMILQSKGMEAGDATKAAMAFLQKSLVIQTNTISYDEAFLMIIVAFCIGGSLLIVFKIWLARRVVV
ncbi:hypothetical protein RCS94_05190 [Orbaceae bacterium ac157xtp]